VFLAALVAGLLTVVAVLAMPKTQAATGKSGEERGAGEEQGADTGSTGAEEPGRSR
jgi:hypothetical protein